MSTARSRAAYSNVKPLVNISLALTHYNAAIKELMSITDQGLVLLICVLFICIELSQSDRDAALRHYRHGNAILKSFDSGHLSWIDEWLRPQFHRLHTLYYFFGDRSESPGWNRILSETPIFFSTLKEAEDMIGNIFNHSFQLVRRGAPYRVGAQQHEQPGAELLQEQGKLSHLPNVWYTVFNNLEAKSTHKSASIPAVRRAYLLSKYRLCRIWTAMAFSPSEMDYDKYEDDYRRIVKDLGQAADERTRSRSRNNFEFEMGFIVPIFFMIIKCRYLDLRLQALSYLQVLAAPREALWEKTGMYALARRIIEIEHGLLLNTDGTPSAILGSTCQGLPPNEKRVVHFVTGWTGENSNDFEGHKVQERNVFFVFKSLDDRVLFRPDVIDEEPVPLPAWSPEATKREVLPRAARI
ncbi:C6 zinc finger domain protein [Colletotrichum camelliae]|nr:C6 zinc finger domain protein [Colletotrichum camelliae]